MDLTSIPAAAKILLTFAAILFANRWLPLSVGIIAGCFTIWGLSGQSRDLFLSAAQAGLSSPETWWLAAAITAIILFSELLGKTGRLEKILDALAAISPGRRFSVSAIAAFIGLLPMPAGALFSAPLVDKMAGAKANASGTTRMTINLWFRHIWEFWWPLYPGFVLCTYLMRVPSLVFSLLMVPVSLGVMVIGWFFLSKGVLAEHGDKRQAARTGILILLREVTPVLIIVVTFLVLEFTRCLLDKIFPWANNYASFIFGIGIAIVYLCRTNTLHAPDFFVGVWNRRVAEIVPVVLCLSVFQGLIESSNVIAGLKAEMTAFHIAPVWIIAVLPFVAGLVTGITVGFAGVSFPIVVTLVPGEQYLTYGILAYGIGCLGMIMSPVHLCFAATKHYFGLSYGSIYRRLSGPLLLSAVWITLIFWLAQLF